MPTIPMPDLVDLVVEDDRWHNVDLGGLAQKFCAEALINRGYDPANFEISLLGSDDAKIAQLNTQFREKPTPTNVLSWPSAERGAKNPGELPEPPRRGVGECYELGDIAISYGICLREAASAEKPIEQHVSHLLVHATLHLLGYDHIVTEDAVLMEEIETQVLVSLGEPDPYGDM